AVLAAECLGLKPMEVYHLDVDDVNFDEQRLYVRRGLGGRPRKVEIDYLTMERLAQWRRDRPEVADPAFFVSAEKQRLASRTIRSDHKKWAKLAGIDPRKVHPHTIRHTWSLEKHMQGMPEAEQRNKLGLLGGRSAVEALAGVAAKERSR